MKQILCAFIFGFNIYFNLLSQAQNLKYKSLPQNLAVTLNYWQQINEFFAYNEKLPYDCIIKNTWNKRTIICPAWVKILINKKQLLSWQQEQKKNDFINLYLPKMGIMHEKAKIAKIKKIIQQELTSKNQHLVTSFYMRYAHALRYKIKDINTGTIDEITATPAHKFYEATYNKFISISELGPDNTITNASNHYFKIICTNKRHHHCGMAALNSLEKVYNMEVEKAHNYFVGNMKALVHNGCDYYFKCRSCGETHAERDLFSYVCAKTADTKHYLMKKYQCESCGAVSGSDSYITNEHSKIHHNRSGKHICLVCNAKFDTKGVLMSHKRMHDRNGNKIFCRECDESILLESMLSKKHEHDLTLHTPKVTKYNPSRDRSRSPIKELLYLFDSANELDLDKKINY